MKNSGRRDREQGLVVVEYALIFGVAVMGLTGAVQLIHERTEDFYEESSASVGAIPEYDVSDTTLLWGGGPTTTVPSTLPTTTTTTTSTTVPSPTTSTTTTTTPSTTVPPTTGPPTTQPTTTVPSPKSYISNLEDRSYDQSNGNWKARVRVTITRTDTSQPVQGAVINGTFVTADGNTNSTSCTTNSGGKCQMTWGNRNDNDNPTTLTVTNVSASPSWDGVGGSVTLYQP